MNRLITFIIIGAILLSSTTGMLKYVFIPDPLNRNTYHIYDASEKIVGRKEVLSFGDSVVCFDMFNNVTGFEIVDPYDMERVNIYDASHKQTGYKMPYPWNFLIANIYDMNHREIAYEILDTISGRIEYYTGTITPPSNTSPEYVVYNDYYYDYYYYYYYYNYSYYSASDDWDMRRQEDEYRRKRYERFEREQTERGERNREERMKWYYEEPYRKEKEERDRRTREERGNREREERNRRVRSL